MKNKQNILCLNTVQLSTYPPNKIIFLGTELVGAEFVAAKLVRSRVGKGPSSLGLLRAKMSQNREPLSLVLSQVQCPAKS